MFIENLQNKIKNFLQKEIVFFKKGDFIFSVKPLPALQGILLVSVFLFLFIFTHIPPGPEKINQSLVISEFATKTRAVAGKTSEHIVLIKKSEITKNNYYLKLPKTAENIKISSVSSQTAKIALQDYSTTPLVLPEERKVFAKKEKSSIFAGISSLFSQSMADLSEAVLDIMENSDNSQINVPITEQEDSIYVDLSSESEETVQPEELTQETSVAETPAQEPVDEATAEIPADEVLTDKEQHKASKTEQELNKADKEKQTKEKTSKQDQESDLPSESQETVQPEEPAEEPPAIEPPAEELPVDEPPAETPTEETPSDSPETELTEAVPEEQKTVDSGVSEQEYVQITYETPAPEITEQETDTGKLITVLADDEGLPEPISNVVAYTAIPEIYKVGQESKIKLKWKNQGDQEVEFHAYDTDNNGKLDYVEWTIPHLSEQIFEIIFISKAFRLDENKEITEDIYEYVQAKDSNWVTLNSKEYIRVTFEQILDNTKDITVYAKPTGESAGTIQVYEQGTDTLIVEFPAINAENTYKVLLTNLQNPSDVFDLKITGNIDFDYIVDPTVSDSFSDETKIGAGTTYVQLSSGVLIQPCYVPNPSWTKIADTLVRDIAGAYNSTIAKDIYCDDSNCILWTDGAEAPGTVCIATDANVYANILWSKTDVSGTQTWSDTNFDLYGGDIGGTHSTIGVGNGNTAVGTKNWLERYYSNSASGTFNAMDACKAKGIGWRLPTIVELDSIRDQAKGSSPYSRLPNIVAIGYWSSSEYSTTNAYSLYFGSGNVLNLAKSSSYYVRCVRGY